MSRKHDRGALVEEAPNGNEGVEVDVTSMEGKSATDVQNIDLEALSPEARELVAGLQKQLADLTGPKRVASGSKPRPNVTYKLLNQPPNWSRTPQISQIEKILFNQDKREFTEPEIFDLIKKGFDEGTLRTKQNPVRIFQYYRAQLIKDNVLRQQ